MAETQQKVPGTELDQWEYAHSQLTPEAQTRFGIAEMRTIRNTVMPDLNGAEFQMVMAMAARYDLDPLAREIWGVKGKTKNGREGRVLILVGRDGLLKVARRDKHFMGFDTDVVHEKDEFEVRRSKLGREIIHNYKGSTAERGPIVGAYAQVYIQGMHDVYFYAPMEEYKPSTTDSYSPWLKQPSVMIQKCALALCLRLAFNLAGILAEEEAGRVFESADGVQDPMDVVSDIAAMLRRDIDAETADRFTMVFAEAQHYRPGMLTAAAAQMSLTGVTGAQVYDWLDRQNRLNAEAVLKAEESAPIDGEVVPQDDPEGMSETQTRLELLREEAQDEGTTMERVAEIDAEIEELEGQLPGLDVS
jgi:phage recombination protein Bet